VTEITFTGDIHKITRLIEDYKQKGYVYKKHTEHPCDYIIRDDEGRKKVKTVIVYKVTMDKKGQIHEWPNLEVGETIHLSGDVKVHAWALYIPTPTLQEQLSEAIEREDYETAAILRDKINAL
jgi:DNA-binding MarR family transcriptional regulator